MDEKALELVRDDPEALSAHIDRELAGRSLHYFLRESWPILEPRTEFQDDWYLGYLCEHLEVFWSGKEYRELLVCMPPRHGKSLVGSVAFPVWTWGPAETPWERFMLVSYGDKLAVELSVKRRALIKNPWFQARWGHVFKMSEDVDQKGNFENTERGAMFATQILEIAQQGAVARWSEQQRSIGIPEQVAVRVDGDRVS